MSRSCSAEMPAAGSVGAREVFVLTAEAPAPLDTKRWVWISWALFRSTYPRRERRATAAHDSLRVLSRPGASARGSKTPQRLVSSPCLHTPRPRSFPCRRLVGSAASRSPRSSHCPVLSDSSARSKRARHSGARGRLRAFGSPMRLGGVGQRFTCSVESGVRVHRPGACVTATTALDYASRDCRHVDPCHMTPGRVVRHHRRHDTSKCRTTHDTTVVRHLSLIHI